MGVVSLFFLRGKTLVLEDCLYVPNVRRNLISVSSLSCNGFSIIFNKNFLSIKYDVDEICCGMLVDNLYILEPISHLQVNSIESNHKRKEPSIVNQTQFWHLRIGHINLDRIHRLVTSGHLSPLYVNALPVCKPYLKDKMTMRHFKAKGYRAKEILDLIHTGLVGLLVPVQEVGTSISSPSLMITQGTDTYT